MDERPEVPGEVLSRLRSVCLGLPEAYEEAAWVGVRWRIRKRTFASALRIEDGWPPAYARAARTPGPATVVTFRSSGEELELLRQAGSPFFAPPWGPDYVGLVVGPDVDWGEVAELLTESYCVMAPRKLVEEISRPG